MSHQDKIAFLPLKHFLALVAVAAAMAATLLLIFLTTAATDTGSTPDSAILLVQGTNTGVLGPEQQRWFRLIPTHPAGVKQSLTLLFPAPENLRQYISFQLFEQDQVQFFESGQMVSFGSGWPAAKDHQPEIGRLIWRGYLTPGQTYYLQLRNDSDFAIEYELSLTDELNPAPAPVKPAPPPAEVPVVLQPGTIPAQATLLASGPRQGKLAPKSVLWYKFGPTGFTRGDNFQDMNFNLFFTPGDGNVQHMVNFRLFTPAEAESWRPDNTGSYHFGAGALVSRDGDPLTGERIWRGALLRDSTYFLAIENSADIEIDYWLFDQDVIHPQLGAEPLPATAPVFAPGAAPDTAIPLNFGQTIGKLDPGQELWYSFSLSDHDEDYFEEMALTMGMTPEDGQRIQRVTFDIFTQEGVRNWSPGNREAIHNVGAGSIVTHDNNPLTGERFWSGWVVDNDLYYVRLNNGADIPIDYWLITGGGY